MIIHDSTWSFLSRKESTIFLIKVRSWLLSKLCTCDMWELLWEFYLEFKALKRNKCIPNYWIQLYPWLMVQTPEAICNIWENCGSFHFSACPLVAGAIEKIPQFLSMICTSGIFCCLPELLQASTGNNPTQDLVSSQFAWRTNGTLKSRN